MGVGLEYVFFFGGGPVQHTSLFASNMLRVTSNMCIACGTLQIQSLDCLPCLICSEAPSSGLGRNLTPILQLGKLSCKTFQVAAKGTQGKDGNWTVGGKKGGKVGNRTGEMTWATHTLSNAPENGFQIMFWSAQPISNLTFTERLLCGGHCAKLFTCIFCLTLTSIWGCGHYYSVYREGTE